MVKVPDDIRAIFTKQRVIPMATADLSGYPNVVYVGMWYWSDEETLCISDNYMNKTMKNLMENPLVAFNGWADGKSYQIKCRVCIENSGPRFDEIRRLATTGQRQYPGKAAVFCKVEEVFQGNGGPGAGQKLV